jgi:quercetin dioxygenase-like cupin family protein
MPNYFAIEDPRPQPQDALLDGVLKRCVWMDDDVVRGAPYFDAAWILGDIPKGPEPHLHRHDFDEFLGFMGGDINAPMELGCEIEIIVDGEAMTLGKTCLIFIPAGVRHGIVSVTGLTKPVLCYSGGPNVRYAADGDDG